MTKKQKCAIPVPRWIRCYDNGGKSFDRYTVVFTGNYHGRNGCDYLAMSEHPFHPQGFGQHGWNQNVIDRPTYSHLGKKIKFEDLPEDCQKLVASDYKEIWGIQGETYEKVYRLVWLVTYLWGERHEDIDGKF